MSPSRPDGASSFDELLLEDTDAGTASAPYSFEERSAYLGKACSQGYPTAARYSVSGQAPRLTEAILLGERIHLALVELSDGSSIFTGCDESGKPLKGHAHAYVLSESNLALGKGCGGEITHVTIYAPAGFGTREVSALEDIKEVQGSGLYVQLNLMGIGQIGDFSGLNINRGECPLLAKSRTWVSRTPFIPTRYPKATRAGVPKVDESGLQIGSPEHELKRLLRLEHLPEPVAVESISSTDLAGCQTSWSRFRRSRSSGDGRRAGSYGYGFRIEFAEVVQGPIAVGYGAHFGMGGFVPPRSVMD